MGAVEHLKTLCCLGLPPESAMISVVPLLHEVVPHGWSGLTLLAPDATITGGYAENPEAAALYRERLWRFMDDPSALTSLWGPAVRAVGIGWTLAPAGRRLPGKWLFPGNRGTARFLLDFGRDDRRWRPDYRIC